MKKSSVNILCDKVKEKFGITLKPDTFKRLYPGHWQRSSGCCSWIIEQEGSVIDFGSTHSVSELLKHWDLVELYFYTMDQLIINYNYSIE